MSGDATDRSWMVDAACRGSGELFFTPEGERGSERIARRIQAQSMCRRCSVLTRCGAYALDTKSEFGVWAGVDLTPTDSSDLVGHRHRRLRDALEAIS